MKNGPTIKNYWLGWLQPFLFDPRELKNPTVIFLILVGLVPIFGILFLGWEIFPLMILIWLENLIIVIFTIFKMILSPPYTPGNWLKKVFMIPFFCLHYGFFTFWLGIAFFFFFKGNYQPSEDFPTATVLIQISEHYQLIWGILALFLSHAVSFCIHYIGKGEYKNSSLNMLMFEPYIGIATMEIILFCTALIIQALTSITHILIILMVLKTYLDILIYMRQRKKYLDIKFTYPT